jgi:hypothetical protein
MNSDDITKRRATAAGALIEKTRQTLIEKTIAEMKSAERLLAAQTLKTYLITYRLDSKTQTAKGSYSERRDHLIALIKALAGTKTHHVSTSAWIVKSHHATAALVCALLGRALDLKIDLIGADHVGAMATLGHSGLED